MAIPYSSSNSIVSNTDYYKAFSNLGATYNLPISDPFTGFQKSQLETSLSVAKSTGDKKWEQIVGYVLKYGGAALGILASTGIIKNKNVDSVINGEYDGDKASDLDALGKAYINRNANDNPTPTPQTIKVFGIELTPINLIILVVAIILIYNQFSSPKSKK